MASLALAVLAIFILSHASRAQRAGTGTAEELLDKNAFQQSRPLLSVTNPLAQNRRNSKSMSFIDYFFPPSRQAKVSKNFKSSKQITEQPPTTLTEKISEPTTPTKSYDEIIQTTPVTEGAFSVTLEEGRATGSTKKGTTGKRRTSQTRTTAIPKQKTSQKNTQSTHSSSSTHVTQSVKSTQKSTTSKPVTKQDTTYANTMTTHKHYTIYPNVMSKTNPPTSLYHTKRPDTTVAQGSTGSQAHRVTLAELAKVTENKPSGALPAAAAESTTESRQREGELELREKPSKQPAKVTVENKNESVALPDGSTVLVKPTKYHYYPHNQHIYLLPECAIQQVCNAVYVRLNYTQPLCACPSRHRDPCSASLNADDLHTTQLTTDSKKKYASKAVTLVKTCEATSEMRECRSPRDWSLLALQNIRTGKSHYLVICRCPEENVLEGPMAHDQPTYASVPGIRVYGMMCVQQTQFSSQGYGVSSRPPMSSYKVGYSQPNYSQDQYTGYPDYVGPGVYYGRSARNEREIRSGKRRIQLPPIPWDKVKELADTANWEN